MLSYVIVRGEIIVSKPLFNKIVIVGLGLMGASLGLAIKKNGLAGTTVGLVRRPQSVRLARRYQVVDQVTMNGPQAVADAELVVLAGPVSSTPKLLEGLLPFLPEGCLVTDVGSTKQEVTASMKRLLQSARRSGKRLTYIGSHPMAGSEKNGLAAAKASLYDQATCLIMLEKHEKQAHQRLKRFWEKVGCGTVLEVTPKQHDAITALASHLPHAVAVALTMLIKKKSKEHHQLMRVVSTGFKDTTRIAAGSPEMWVDIFLSNDREMVKTIDQLVGELQRLRKMIAQKQPKQLTAQLEAIRTFRLKVGRD